MHLYIVVTPVDEGGWPGQWVVITFILVMALELHGSSEERLLSVPGSCPSELELGSACLVSLLACILLRTPEFVECHNIHIACNM